jgi:hypothetical protein
MNGKALDLGALDTRRFSETGRELALRHPGTGAAAGARHGARLRCRRLPARARRAAAAAPRAPADAQAHGRRDPRRRARALARSSPAGLGLSLDGQPFEYSPTNAVVLLRRFPWIREQVEGAAADRGKFLPASSAS